MAFNRFIVGFLSLDFDHHQPPPRSGAGAGLSPRAQVSGKFLFRAGKKLHLKGVTYGTFRPGPHGDPFPALEVVRSDFARMAHLGLNAVRTYTSAPLWLLDEAAEVGLSVLSGLPWEQHVDFLSDRRRARDIRRRVKEAARASAGHPALLARAVGNEIPGPIVRWSGRRRTGRFLESLCAEVKDVDPDGLVTYANYPTTEYLELPFLDFMCFNVYLEQSGQLASYLDRLQNIAGDLPLVLGEIGLDSRQHGELGQARSVEAQVRTAFQAGCAGAFVFAWTDEWHRGGEEVNGWDFGLTSRARQPKPALAALRRTLPELPVSPNLPTPQMSVVVCVYNAASTLTDTLEGIGRLRYPNFETIVVDDGSTDATAEIAGRYDVRLIRTENRGLSAARNTGTEAANGEIVAFIDGDAWPDPDWLTYLAQTFVGGGWAGVGGPNLPPPGDGIVADAVACSPGGPAHVLISDQEAEHIPGCNMAFWRSALLDVGGFDARFRVAGDDVDMCWKLQERGWRLGYSPVAQVWHHYRNSVRAYWRQQWGYGRAEALLEAKWPAKYNPAGHVTWGGRVYSRGLPSLLSWTSRVYHGTWGDAPFQSLHHRDATVLGALMGTPEWFLLLLVLSVLTGLGALWTPLLVCGPFLLVGAGGMVWRAVRFARRARYPTARVEGRTARMGITAGLHLLQPLARLLGRLSHGLTPWRLGRRGAFAFPRRRRVAVWSERWESIAGRLRDIETRLRSCGGVVLRGGVYDRWDLEVRGGVAGGARVRSVTEEHGQGRQLVRFHIVPIMSPWVLVLGACFTGLGAWAAADGARVASAALGALATAVWLRVILECGNAVGAALQSLDDPTPVAPDTAREAPLTPSIPAAAGALKVASR